MPIVSFGGILAHLGDQREALGLEWARVVFNYLNVCEKEWEKTALPWPRTRVVSSQA
jgi:hypothetical protein